MSDIQPKLKLKRKKLSSDQDLFSPRTKSESEVWTEAGPERPTTSAPSASTSTSAPSASACSGADGLWALTLRWVLQEIQEPPGSVPELPPPSALSRRFSPADEEWELSDEVPPLPEYCPLQTRDESSQDAPLSPPTPQSQESPLPRPTETRVTPEERGGTEGETEEDRVTPEERGGTEGEAGRLMQSCPLCLLLFPLGFTQLDRDSHLAQCLSEVNIDVTW